MSCVLTPYMSCIYCWALSEGPWLYPNIPGGLTSKACCANFSFSRCPSLKFCLCSMSCQASGLPIPATLFRPHSHGMLYTQCGLCCGPACGLVLIIEPLVVFFCLNTVLILYWFAMCLNSSETPFTWVTIMDPRGFFSFFLKTVMSVSVKS